MTWQDKLVALLEKYYVKVLAAIALIIVLCCCGTVGYQVVMDNKLESCTDSNGSVHWYKTEKQEPPCW